MTTNLADSAAFIVDCLEYGRHMPMDALMRLLDGFMDQGRIHEDHVILFSAAKNLLMDLADNKNISIN